MKKIFSFITLILLAANFVHAEDFLHDVVLLSGNDKVIKVTSVGKSPQKKLATANAIKSAIDTYIFYGIEGLKGNETGCAAEDAHSSNPDYFVRLYEEDRYKTFVKSFVELDKPKKDGLGNFHVRVEIEIYRLSLDRDLERNNILPPPPPAPTDPRISIMVVPYRSEGKTFSDILNSDYDLRAAVAKVQDEFRTKNIETVDFEARYNAALRRNQYESESAYSFDAELLRTCGTDVYVTVDVDKRYNASGLSLGLSLKAYETATGRVLASVVQSSGVYRTNDFDKLCIFTIQQLSDKFLKDVHESLTSGGGSDGSSPRKLVTISISIDGASYMTLGDVIGDAGFDISDYLRAWVKKNSEGGVYHLQGKTDVLMVFDSVDIPQYDETGIRQDASDYAASLTRYLRKLGLNASNRIDGQTIYITLSD